MFFFKQKQIVLDAFTSVAPIHDNYGFAKATEHLPDWWKQLPSSYDVVDENNITYKNSTMKKCAGFIDYYRNSIILPMWADLILKTHNDNWAARYSAKDLPAITSHDRRQHNSHFEDMIHIKLETMWTMREKTGVNFAVSAPFFSDNMFVDKINIIPGILNFKYQSSININLLMRPNTEVMIPNGMPLIHLIPLTESNVIVKNHLVSYEEWNRMQSNNYSSSFTSKYKRNVELMKKKENKCPFGFGRK
jgi:hypothetical protein